MGGRFYIVLLEMARTLSRDSPKGNYSYVWLWTTSKLDRQPEYKDELIRDQVREKLEKVVAKGYIEMTDIEFLEAIMYLFHVVKGDDIRMVYYGSKSGLNKSLWAPWVALPTAESMTRWVTVG